ncbi:MAG: TOBE domain-containing protein, partial [Nitratireductor sp.]
PIELYERPQNLFVAGFIGSPKMNFLAAEIVGPDAGGLRVSSPETGELLVTDRDMQGLAPGAPVTLGIRPEHLVPAAGANGDLLATVRLVERLGDQTLLEMETQSGATLVAKAPPERRFAPGAPVALDLVAGKTHLFDRNGKAVARREP